MTLLHNSLEENEQVIFGTQCLCVCGRTDSISGLLLLQAKLARRQRWIEVSPYLLAESEVFHCTSVKSISSLLHNEIRERGDDDDDFSLKGF